MRHTRAVGAILSVVLVAGLAGAGAQVVGATLGGRVQDKTGASLPDSSVTVRSDETGAQRALTTDGDGRFSAPSLPVGEYSITVAHAGFETQQEHGISLVVGQTRGLTVTLELGRIEQQVVVSTQGPTINTSTQETSGVVDERQVKQLPLNGRSFDGLLTLNPATVNYTAERSGSVGTSNSSVGNMLGERTAAAGQFVSAERNRVHGRVAD